MIKQPSSADIFIAHARFQKQKKLMKQKQRQSSKVQVLEK